MPAPPLDHEPLVGNDRFEGYIADLLKQLGKITQTNYIIQPVEDGRYEHIIFGY